MDYTQIVDAVINRLGTALRMDLDIAKKLIEGIEKESARRGLKAVIAVCNSQGNPMAVHSMDGAYLASFDIALKKAYTSVAMKMSTKELGELAQPGGPLYGIDKADNGRLIIFGGGVPLRYQGILLGGLGVSGGSVQEDSSMAEYGAALFERLLFNHE